MRCALLTAVVLVAAELGGCASGGEQAEARWDKSATTEPARIAAHIFSSVLPLGIWVQKAETDTWEFLDTTRARPALMIPECTNWFVEPLDTWDGDWAALALTIALDHIPGLVVHTAQDADLAHLKGFDGLRLLDLSRTQVTDAGVAHLKDLKRLQILRLASTKVTDVGLADLTKLKRLQSLHLEETGITDAGLAHLAQLKGLQRLDLSRTQVTDAGLAQLTALKGLRELWLIDCTQVTDAGVTHLKELNGLQWLALHKTGVTKKGMDDLRRALPDCRIR